MVFTKCIMRLAGIFQAKRFVHVYFKRTRTDQRVESVDERGIKFSIVRFDSDVFRSSRLRHHAIWIRDTSAFANRQQGSIGSLASRGYKCGIDSIRRELLGCVQNIIASSIDYTVSSQFFGKLHTVVTGSDGEHFRAESLGEL